MVHAVPCTEVAPKQGVCGTKKKGETLRVGKGMDGIHTDGDLVVHAELGGNVH